ncbi:MAG TPA: A/G-specific adenine glycosylase [Ktedonobacterales bacterium]|jgi:A/G-specific adenine glycosylase
MAHRERRAPAADTEAAASPEQAARRGAAHAALLAWYAANGRDLPWRHTRDPYAILVSEVMLQQTQVERVLPKYREFLARFPTLAALAAAPVAEVIRAWAPLGYNVRAVRLRQIARQAVDEFGGALPGTVAGLLALKGIGRYTAGAVACFAFGAPVATVDTNIRRVLWRVLRGVEPAAWPAGTAAARDALALAEWALPVASAYDWQQALMDLGATICASRRPACERCPLAPCCAALAEVGTVTLFPSGEALAALRASRADHAPAARRVAESAAPYAVGSDGKSAPAARAPRSPAPPFTSTSRYFRGRALAALRALPAGGALTVAELGPRVKPDWRSGDEAWLRALVTGLARDGLVEVRAAAPGAADGAVRVALPE